METNYVKLECFQTLDCDDDYDRMICIPKGTKEKHLKDMNHFCDTVKVVSDNIDVVNVIAQVGKLETSLNQRGKLGSSPETSKTDEEYVETRSKI